MSTQWLKRVPRPRARRDTDIDETALKSLTREERRQISMDCWEPSLLRKLLSAQNRLKKD